MLLRLVVLMVATSLNMTIAYGMSLDGLPFVSSQSLPQGEVEYKYDASLLSSFGSHFGITVANIKTIGIDEIAIFTTQSRPLAILKSPLITQISKDGKLLSFDKFRLEYIDRGYKKYIEHPFFTIENTIQFTGTDELKNTLEIIRPAEDNTLIDIELVVNGFENQENRYSIEGTTVSMTPKVDVKHSISISLDASFPAPQIINNSVFTKKSFLLKTGDSVKIANILTLPYFGREQYSKRYNKEFSVRDNFEKMVSDSKDMILKNSIHTLENTLWAPLENYKNQSGSFTSVSTKYGYPLMIPWDSAFNALGFSVFLNDPSIPQSIMMTILDNECDNFLMPNVIFEDRVKNTCAVSNPPMLSYTVYEIYKKYQDKYFLEFAYPKLVNTIDFWQINRDKNKNGLLEYDTNETRPMDVAGRQRFTMYESAWDDNRKFLPEFNGGFLAYEIEPVELNSLLYKEYISLSKMAQILGKKSDHNKYLLLAHNLKQKMDTLMKNPETGIYQDISIKTGEKIKYLTPHIFFPMFARIADDKTAEILILKYLKNDRLFWPTIPTVAFNQKGYSESGSFYGPTWLQVYYFVYVGVQNYNTYHQYDEVLHDMREFLINLHQHNNFVFFERYNSNPLSPNALNGLTGIAKTNYGWSSAITLKILYDKSTLSD